MTYAPTKEQIREFGLQPHEYNGETHWILPNASPETWESVEGLSDAIMWAAYHFTPEQVWLGMATGDPGATVGWALMLSIVVVAASLGVAVACQRLYRSLTVYATREWDSADALSAHRVRRIPKRGTTPRKTRERRVLRKGGASS